MKIFNFIFLLLFVVAFTACESKKTRAEIEAEFEEYDGSASSEGITTSTKRSTDMSDGAKSFNGSLTDLAKDEEQKKTVEANATAETSNPTGTIEYDTESSSTDNNPQAASVASAPTGAIPASQSAGAAEPARNVEPARPATAPATPAKPATPAQPAAPAKTATPAAPAKAADPAPARQQTVVQKSEPGKRDVIVDGQAQ